MPTEYWLQKKAFNSWSHVTWYDSLEEAKTNFNRVSVEGNGYSWRMVRVEVIEERLLEGERPVLKPEVEDFIKPAPPIKNSGWATTPAAAGWGNSTAIDDIKAEGHHGLSGSVWMVHFGLKKKTRVPADQMAALIEQGYERGSPRTEFK